ncbi:hypothetical protein E2P60_06120 [Candidatus Bathyarchaeota archaeon]|nr:hypothetical protein E2P60_06120 [Candidatus Bathyarchaeota archaeon]
MTFSLNIQQYALELPTLNLSLYHTLQLKSLYKKLSFLHVKTAKEAPIICIMMNITPSCNLIPASEYVNIRTKVTCGLANMVLEVAIRIPPTKRPTTSEVLLDF